MRERRRWLPNRLASFGFSWMIIGGTTVGLHIFTGNDRFGDGSAWYLIYAVLGLGGIALFAAGMWASRDAQRTDKE